VLLIIQDDILSYAMLCDVNSYPFMTNQDAAAAVSSLTHVLPVHVIVSLVSNHRHHLRVMAEEESTTMTMTRSSCSSSFVDVSCLEE
jgi:hypothetical protein